MNCMSEIMISIRPSEAALSMLPENADKLPDKNS